MAKTVKVQLKSEVEKVTAELIINETYFSYHRWRSMAIENSFLEISINHKFYSDKH